MEKQPIAVIFSAVGTLIEPAEPLAETYARVGHRHGSTYSVEEIESRYAEAFRAREEYDCRWNLRTNESAEQERWSQIITDVLDDADDPQACFVDLFEHYADPASWRIFSDARRILADLESRGVPMVVASNFDRRLCAVVGGHPELQVIKALFISSRVGHRKPAAPFFQAVLDWFPTDASRVLYVGDDRRADHEGARALGIASVIVNRHGPTGDEDEINSLDILPEILGRLSALPGSGV